MASRVEFAVSCTPIAMVGAGTDYAAHDVICVDTGKSLGASGAVTSLSLVSVGYSAGNPTYVTSGSNAYTIGQTAASLGTFTSIRFVYIKHTGYLFSSGSVLGAATTLKLKICSVATIADATTIAVLNPGEAIILPYSVAITPTLYAASETSSNPIAVEVYGTT